MTGDRLQPGRASQGRVFWSKSRAGAKVVGIPVAAAGQRECGYNPAMPSLRDFLHEQPTHGDRTAWQALDYLNIYRLFVAMLYTGLFFTPLMEDAYPSATLYAAKSITVVYLVISPMLFIAGRRIRSHIGTQAGIGLLMDLLLTWMMLRMTGGASGGIGVLLAGPMGAAGAIFPVRSALVYAAIATLALLWQSVFDVLGGGATSSVVPNALLGATCFATTMLGAYLAFRGRESQAIARQRSADLANMAALNEMIIERMRTGILIIDTRLNTHVMNESAWLLLGMPEPRTGKLKDLSPEIHDDMLHWLDTGEHLSQNIHLAPGLPPVAPRYAPLASGIATDILVFLEDTSLVSRRAQELTLASLGRLSASIAHEIRNPLAAISHSAQLLAESEDLGDGDRRLSEIITRHCTRMNEIIENVLQLARQEPAQPEPLDLSLWTQTFLQEFDRVQELGRHQLTVEGHDAPLLVLFDPVQLQQVLWNLVQNALKYGHVPSEPAKVTIRWGEGSKGTRPFLEVADRGPGIPEDQWDRIFQPFFTSSSDGTGLGLYLCQQLCAANQAVIEYLASEDFGSCFRVSLQSAETIKIAPENHAEPAEPGHPEG
jgi:two-component system sensor histidine kinase PilS (NtrC family)